MTLIKGPRKLKYSIEGVKNIFSKVSLTPDFKVTFDFPHQSKFKNHLTSCGLLSVVDGFSFLEKLELLCYSTSLPGSSFENFAVTGDHQGQREFFPMFRRYGDQITLSFYVDKDHKVIRFFEEWMNFINPMFSSTGLIKSSAAGQNSTSATVTNNFSKIRYPKDYRLNFMITKFNRDVGNSLFGDTYLSYEFVEAYPTLISPMQVSYGRSDILKLNVSMVYKRYITRNRV